MDLSVLSQSSFWFESTPSYQTNIYLPFVIVFVLMIVFGLVIQFLVKGEFRQIWLKFTKPLFIMPTFGLLYLLSRYEELPWLAARIVFASILFATLVWLMILFIWAAYRIPQESAEKKIEKKFNKYLPKK